MKKEFDLEKLEQLLQQATPGVIYYEDHGDYLFRKGDDQMVAMMRGRGAHLPVETNGEYMAELWNSAPALIQAARRAAEAEYIFSQPEAKLERSVAELRVRKRELEIQLAQMRQAITAMHDALILAQKYMGAELVDNQRSGLEFAKKQVRDAIDTANSLKTK